MLQERTVCNLIILKIIFRIPPNDYELLKFSHGVLYLQNQGSALDGTSSLKNFCPRDSSPKVILSLEDTSGLFKPQNVLKTYYFQFFGIFSV